MSGRGKAASPYERFLSCVSGEKREAFRVYFQQAPDWVLESAVLETVGKGQIILREDEPVDAIYFILSGSIKAVDFRVSGVNFDFVRFDRFYAMGGMEIIMDLPKYKTTLQAVTGCQILKIRSSVFRKWLDCDPRATKREARLVCGYLLEEGRLHRINLFLSGKERLMLLYVKRYEKYACRGEYTDLSTRQELADATALSLKTVNRALDELCCEGLVTRKGRRVVVTGEDCGRIKAILSQKVLL